MQPVTYNDFTSALIYSHFPIRGQVSINSSLCLSGSGQLGGRESDREVQKQGLITAEMRAESLLLTLLREEQGILAGSWLLEMGCVWVSKEQQIAGLQPQVISPGYTQVFLRPTHCPLPMAMSLCTGPPHSGETTPTPGLEGPSCSGLDICRARGSCLLSPM